jgi:DNA-binding NarL/FixJ family response regulator
MLNGIRVLLVDYDIVTQEGIRVLLAKGGTAEVVATAETATGFTEALRSAEPDVVITDIWGHGGTGGVDVLRACNQRHRAIPVIILTENENDPHAFSAVTEGIAGYLLRRNATPDTLASAIRSVMQAGMTVISTPLMKAVTSSLRQGANETLGRMAGLPNLVLTPRELEVLRQMASGESNGSIAVTLGISHETVRKYVARIVEKLGARNRVHASILAARSGLTGSGRMSGESSP